jgi:hypothetical protein
MALERNGMFPLKLGCCWLGVCVWICDLNKTRGERDGCMRGRENGPLKRSYLEDFWSFACAKELCLVRLSVHVMTDRGWRRPRDNRGGAGGSGGSAAR